MMRVIDLCDAHGIAGGAASPYFGPGFIATLHIAAALVERPLVEVLWLEMEANPFDPWVRAVRRPGQGADRAPAWAAIPIPRCSRAIPRAKSTRTTSGARS